METAVTAPYGGVVAAVEVVANAQVDAGAPLLRIRADATEQPATGSRAAVDLTGLVAREPAGTPPCERVYGALCGYLLGYDLDPATVRALLTRQRRLGEVSPPADAGLLHCEDGLLDLFADVGSLYRPRTEPAEDDGLDAPQEYLLSYLQWLDPERAGLPDPYRQRLQTTLRRYGVAGLERTPQLEAAVVWMFRSFSRVGELVPVVSAILERRLRHSTELAGALGDPPGLRA